MSLKTSFTPVTMIFFFICNINEVTGRKNPSICLMKCSCSENQDTFVVDCSNAGLESVPKGIPSRTTNLDLDNNKIQVLHTDSFVQSRTLSNLTKLSIRSNQLKKIEINAFQGLWSLKILDLYNNSLEFKNSYPKSVFVPISQSLNVLDIRRNLQGKIIHMNYPLSVGELVGLKELKMDCLHNKSLPMEYGKMKNLTKISFSDGRKQIGFVSDDMFLAVSDLDITDIDFAGLNIGTIGTTGNTFLNVPRLKILDLSNNEYLNFIDIISALNETSIESLKLNNTGIGKLVNFLLILKNLGELQQLKRLTLDNNSIRVDCSGPIFSEYFPQLEVLSVGNNFISDNPRLRVDFMNMKHLIGLNWSYQPGYTGQTSLPQWLNF